jgi:hypothetical protein
MSGSYGVLNQKYNTLLVKELNQSSGGGSQNLEQVLAVGNSANNSINLNDTSIINRAKITVANGSGGNTQINSSDIYIGDNTGTNYSILSNTALEFFPGGQAIQATSDTNLDIGGSTISFSGLGGSSKQVLTQNADGNAIWADSGGTLQNVLLGGNTANVQGDIPTDPNYLPLGLGVLTQTSVGAPIVGSYLTSNIQTDGDIFSSEQRCFSGLFCGSYITNSAGANIGISQYGYFANGFFRLTDADNTGTTKKQFFADFKNGFQYTQSLTDGQSMALKLKLKLVDVNGNETNYDQNSASITSNNVFDTGTNQILLDATEPSISCSRISPYPFECKITPTYISLGNSTGSYSGISSVVFGTTNGLSLDTNGSLTFTDLVGSDYQFLQLQPDTTVKWVDIPATVQSGETGVISSLSGSVTYATPYATKPKVIVSLNLNGTTVFIPIGVSSHQFDSFSGYIGFTWASAYTSSTATISWYATI